MVQFMLSKKADMSWWMIMLILALLFLLMMVIISSGILDKVLNTLGGIQDKTGKEAEKNPLFSSSSPARFTLLFSEHSGTLSSDGSFLSILS